MIVWNIDTEYLPPESLVSYFCETCAPNRLFYKLISASNICDVRPLIFRYWIGRLIAFIRHKHTHIQKKKRIIQKCVVFRIFFTSVPCKKDHRQATVGVKSNCVIHKIQCLISVLIRSSFICRYTNVRHAACSVKYKRYLGLRPAMRSVRLKWSICLF